MKERLKLKTEEAILSNVPNLPLKVMVNIELTFGWQSGLIDQYFKKYNLSRQQYNVLRIVRGQKGALISVNDIKTRMLDKMSNVTRLLDKLEERGLVQRIECNDDRRVRWITLTDIGLSLMEQLDEVVPVIQTKLDKLTSQESKQLIELLEKYRG